MKFFFILTILTFLLIISLTLAQFDCKYETKKDGGVEIKCPKGVIPFGEEKRKMNIYGTDYLIHSSGTVFLQLLDEGKPVNNALCILNIYNPDKTKWLDDANMLFLENGVYYYDIFTPDVDGVFPLTVRCLYFFERLIEKADNFTLVRGIVTGGDITKTYEKDGLAHIIKESTGQLDIIYDFYNISLPITVNQTYITFAGLWTSKNELVNISIYNYQKATWDVLPNKVYFTSVKIDVNNIIYNIIPYIKNNSMRVRFTSPDIDDTLGTLKVDYLSIEFGWLSGVFTNEIRGGGEIHVSKFMVPELDDLIAIIFALHSSPITKQYCENNTLIIEKVANWTVKEKLYPITKTERVECTWGCDFLRQECKPKPEFPILIAIGIVFFIIIILMLYRRFV